MKKKNDIAFYRVKIYDHVVEFIPTKLCLFSGQNMIPQPAAPPPSYNEAMSQPPVQSVTVTEHYAKQSPYNPNF